MLDVARTATVPPETIDTYVAELDRALRGPRAVRADLILEARDSLVDATEAFQAGGLERAEAERAAVLEFGDVPRIAAGYRSELALAQARRTAVLLTAVMFMQPIIWVEGRWPWNDTAPVDPSPLTTALNAMIELVGMAVMVGAVLAVAACGIGVRFAAARRYAAGATATFSLVSCTLMPLIGVGLSLSGRHGAAAVVTSLLWFGLLVAGPLALVAVSAGRCLAIASR
jgi:hypothetical protein